MSTKEMKNPTDLAPSEAKVISQWLQKGQTFRRRGQYQQARTTFQAALGEHPGNPSLLFSLAATHADMGNVQGAIDCLVSAIEIRPDWALALQNLGSLHQNMGRFSEALHYYIRALNVDPDLAEVHNNIGVILNQHKQVPQASAAFEAALKIKPRFHEARINLGIAKNALGDSHGAQNCFQQVLSENPTSAKAFYHLINSDKILPDQASSLFRLAKGMEQSLTHPDDLSHFHFAMGKLLDETGDYNQAFSSYCRANELDRRKCHFDPDEHRAHISEIVDTFSKAFIQKCKTFGSGSDRPVFIVGMPRSGTTLVEQIISSHPLVYGGGELDFFARFEDPEAEKFGLDSIYPHVMRELTSTESTKIADKYLALLDKLPGITSQYVRVTDKMPLNSLMIGFIYTLFPNAHIIHCRRNPLDTCLSIFMTKFEEHLPFAFDLVETADYYCQYNRLMQHWHEVIPAQIHEVHYEELISSPEAQAKALIRACDLQWHPQCLDFTRNKRPIQTASYWQARQPIYNTSIGRWQNYAAHIEKAIQILAEDIWDSGVQGGCP